MKIIKKIRKKRRKLIRRFFKSPIKKRLAQYSKTHPRFSKVLEENPVYQAENLLLVAGSWRDS